MTWQILQTPMTLHSCLWLLSSAHTFYNKRCNKKAPIVKLQKSNVTALQIRVMCYKCFITCAMSYYSHIDTFKNKVYVLTLCAKNDITPNVTLLTSNGANLFSGGGVLLHMLYKHVGKRCHSWVDSLADATFSKLLTVLPYKAKRQPATTHFVKNNSQL